MLLTYRGFFVGVLSLDKRRHKLLSVSVTGVDPMDETARHNEPNLDSQQK
jgi:hypothetical protein